jgi:hypothetical protein
LILGWRNRFKVFGIAAVAYFTAMMKWVPVGCSMELGIGIDEQVVHQPV